MAYTFWSNPNLSSLTQSCQVTSSAVTDSLADGGVLASEDRIFLEERQSTVRERSRCPTAARP